MDPLFQTPMSRALLAQDGQLLGATVATDGQWRMITTGSIPDRFRISLLEFEDRHFMDHHGVHLPSIVRAVQQNLHSGRIVSGGSTITMQLARMSGAGGERTYGKKMLEILKALRIELRHEKEEILAMYAANAPFGANVVGLEAASWRWFGRAPGTLSWAECALLAVLPNAPSKIYPGKGREALLAKRDRLLARLHEHGHLDALELSLALQEPLPDAPASIPRHAPHLLATLSASRKYGPTIRTTLDAGLQQRVSAMADRYAAALRANEVHNAAVLVMEVPSGHVLAYVGNLSDTPVEHAPAVDLVQARRSTGSLLKPFLYASMLHHGEMMPEQLMADIPTYYEGFTPKNFDQRHDGAVPASRALARSLNVPAVRALRDHGIDRSLRTMRAMGLHHLDKSAGHYGLSLIVGGAESTLWELTGAYASMARMVLEYGGAPLPATVIHPPRVVPHERADTHGHTPFSAAAAYHTIQALQQLDRPETEQGWNHFGGERIAWKTGTSYGHRDAWAIGITDRYAVGVWTGNATGEGRPGTTGTLAAAPLLFEVFGILPSGIGFQPPYDDMERIPVCRMSGHRASRDCMPVDTTWTISAGFRTPQCPYHKIILVSPDRRYRIGPGPDAVATPWFTLPPAMEYYHAATNTAYQRIPPWAAGHTPANEIGVMEVIHPEPGARIRIPIKLDGEHGKMVLEAVHREQDAVLHWDISGEHVGTTSRLHQLPLDISAGRHLLTISDQRGRSISVPFQVERSRDPR